MDDWRSPKAGVKRIVKQGILSFAALSGAFIQIPRQEEKTKGANTVAFYGHRPGQARKLNNHRETRLVYEAVRPEFELATGITYSTTGTAYIGKQIIEKYSVKPILIKEILGSRPTASHTVPQCVIVECELAYSYGDWTHCYLGRILTSEFRELPVFVPKVLADKDYVRRDLERAQINWITSDRCVWIEEAVILRKKNPLTYWSPAEVSAYRHAFGCADPVVPKEKSISYLGRFDTPSETFSRDFPSEYIAKYVASRKGEVIRQSRLTTETAASYASSVETVIGDHGSGMLNILFWRPRTVIELVVDNVWVNNTLFVADAIGVQNFGVLMVDNLSHRKIAELLDQCLAHFESGESIAQLEATR